MTMHIRRRFLCKILYTQPYYPFVTIFVVIPLIKINQVLCRRQFATTFIIFLLKVAYISEVFIIFLFHILKYNLYLTEEQQSLRLLQNTVLTADRYNKEKNSLKCVTKTSIICILGLLLREKDKKVLTDRVWQDQDRSIIYLLGNLMERGQFLE
jgi:hypothetical protein